MIFFKIQPFTKSVAPLSCKTKLVDITDITDLDVGILQTKSSLQKSTCQIFTHAKEIIYTSRGSQMYTLSTTGVPNLSLTMHPFNSADKHVPLKFVMKKG